MTISHLSGALLSSLGENISASTELENECARTRIFEDPDLFALLQCLALSTCQFFGIECGSGDPTTFVRYCGDCAKSANNKYLRVINSGAVQKDFLLSEADLKSIPQCCLPDRKADVSPGNGSRQMKTFYNLAAVIEKAEAKFGRREGFQMEVKQHYLDAVKSQGQRR